MRRSSGLLGAGGGSVQKGMLLSLLISLLGLLMMSKAVSQAVKDPFSSVVHYMFILNSILCFKNNIELNYADIMSSTVRKIRTRTKKIPTRGMVVHLVDSGVKMFVISSVVSFLIGIFSCYANLWGLARARNVRRNLLFCAVNISASVFAGVCGSLSTMLLVVLCILGSTRFDCNPDNVILPIIASSADYVSTVSLVYFSKHACLFVRYAFPDLFQGSDSGPDPSGDIFMNNTLLLLLLAGLLFGVFAKNGKKNNNTPRLFETWSLLVAFSVAMAAGVIVDAVSATDKSLAALVPLFNGLSGSVSLIYISQLTSYLNYKSQQDTGPDALHGNSTDTEVSGASIQEAPGTIENPRSTRSLISLLLTTSLLSLISCSLTVYFFRAVPVSYVFLLGILLVVEVKVMYYLINISVDAFEFFNMGVTCHAVPLFNAASDFVGSLTIFATSRLLLGNCN